ncbi:MAG: 50S ribosomal protein L9, partial [Cyanobacteria bacterium P01_H01_bin.130]
MAKRVKLVLRQDIYKLGKNGDLVEVAPGYARNYLLPQKMAIPVTPGVLKQVERHREEERQRKIEERNKAESTKTALATIGLLRVAKPVGEDDAIFGTVTNRELADVLKEFAGVEVDRADIDVPEISKLGKYEATLKLHAEVTATVNFEV